MTFRWLEAVSDEKFKPTKSLGDIIPAVRPKFEALINHATAMGMKPKIRSAGRTCTEQNEQKKLGHSQASTCRSLHTIGRAIDLDLYPNDCSTYTKLGQWWESQGGFWGGRWTQFGACGDAGHFHYMPGNQAVPTSICPADVTLSECIQIRNDYLTREFAKRPGGFLKKVGLVALTGAAIFYGAKRFYRG